MYPEKFDAKVLDERLKMAESAEKLKKNVPRMNFVLLWLKKVKRKQLSESWNPSMPPSWTTRANCFSGRHISD